MPLEVTNLTMGDLTTSGKGTKQIPLRCKDGLLKFQPGPLRVLWQPVAFNEPTATRVPICFAATPEVEDYMNTLDEWVTKALAADSQKYFGTTLSLDQVCEKYTSSLKTSQKGYKHLKAKMNITGRASARFWSPDAKKPGGPPEDWTNCIVEPILEIRGLWFLGKEVGLLVELTDALITENSVACPFG
jgi:hypothetical protein